MGRISKCMLLLVCVCATGSALAKDTARWQVAGDVYKSNKQAKPVAGLAVGAINVDVGMHLERLTLLSGEGHAGKKAAGAGLALGLTLMGVGGGLVSLSVGAFGGAMAAFALVVLLARASGSSSGTGQIILAGIAGSQLFNALTAFLITKSASSEQARGILFWLLGHLSGVRWPSAGLAVPVAATGYAVSAITVRVLARTDSTQAITFWLLALMALGAGALALPGWVALRGEHLAIVAAICVAGALGQYAITEAFRQGEASLIAPLEYTALVWGVGLDLALWGVLPDGITWLGAGIIVASGLYLLRRERVHVEAEHP